MVNDVLDADDLPDQIYFSNATQDDVHIATNAVATKQSATEWLLTIKPNYNGWSYGNLLDPTVGRQKLVSVLRTRDNQELPVDNVWQTDRTLLDGENWRYENRLHFIADIPAEVMAEGETFLLTFEPRPAVELDVVSFDGVPSEGTLQLTQLTEVTVSFNKPVAGDGFPKSAVTLNCQGVAQDTTKIVIERIDDQTFRLDLSEVTTGNGYYVLTIQTANMRDADGFAGSVGRQATWVQYVEGKVNLRIAASPAEGGTMSPETGQYDYGQPVTLTATPSTGYDFLHWTERSVLSELPSFSYTPQGDATLTAVFQPKQFTVTVSYDTKGGTVTGGGTGRYDYGTTLSLTATPATGYLFQGWKVNGEPRADGGAELTVTVTGETTVEAIFEFQPSVTLTGRVTTADDATPIMGATVMLTKDDITYTATTDYQGRYSLEIADRTLSYAVHCEADGYMWSASEDIWFSEGSQVKDFVLLRGATVVLPENGVCTFSSTLPLDLSATDIEAYYVSRYENGNFILQEATRSAPGEGLILKGAIGNRLDIPVLPSSARESSATSAGTDNLLVGTAFAPYTVGEDQVWLMNEDDEDAHFRRADKGFVVPRGKAYVLYTIATDAEVVYIIWSEATLIEMVRKALQDDRSPHYDTGGRPVSKTSKGLHLQQGKKILVK